MKRGSGKGKENKRDARREQIREGRKIEGRGREREKRERKHRLPTFSPLILSSSLTQNVVPCELPPAPTGFNQGSISHPYSILPPSSLPTTANSPQSSSSDTSSSEPASPTAALVHPGGVAVNVSSSFVTPSGSTITSLVTEPTSLSMPRSGSRVYTEFPFTTQQQQPQQQAPPPSLYGQQPPLVYSGQIPQQLQQQVRREKRGVLFLSLGSVRRFLLSSFSP